MRRPAAALLAGLAAAALAAGPARPAATAATAGTAGTAGRHVAVIVDTSGSMQGNDRQRYTMQISQILSDLVDQGDELNVIRMPGDLLTSCSAGASSSLVLRLDPADRGGFKRRLDQHTQFNTGTYFAAPIRTAISILPKDRDSRRMLLIIADSGGLGGCEGELTRELQELRRDGVTIAAINLGGTAGAFDRNPAFDFTTPALDAQGLIEAVAQVYQRFLGAKKVQTGQVHGQIEVDIAPFVEEAFLVVAADGPIAALAEGGGNPGAAALDLNHRGGGETTGLDGHTRGYRIARLTRPAAGRWRFQVPGLSDRAGWMLLQDSSVGVRLVSSPTVPKGVGVPMEVELFDGRTGQRITDPKLLPGLQITVDVDGRKVPLRDDGQGGDRQAGDGIFTGAPTFDKVGDQPFAVSIDSDFLDRTVSLQAKVIEAAWSLTVRSPQRAEVDRPVELAVEVRPVGAPKTPPQRIDAQTAGATVALRDDGQGRDRRAGDLVYSAAWTPRETGSITVAYVPVGGDIATPVRAVVEVLGRLRFGPPVPVRLGRVPSESEAAGRLDLGTAEVRGAFDVRLSTPFELGRTALEIDLGDGWVPLGREPRTLRLTETGPRTWPLRLRTGECPEGNPATRTFELLLEATAADGRPLRLAVPLQVEVVADPWLLCWWPVIALGLGIVAAAVLVHGYWSPSRFPPRLGVVLSPEEDMTEGFFHPIRGQKGSRSGFYRDARIWVCQDYRLAGRPRNAVARLRADRKRVRIQPAPGAQIWRQTMDGTWEQVPPGESTARFGDLYRDDPGTLFFELRNA